jgi:polyhydroxybutyrate depolymerase
VRVGRGQRERRWSPWGRTIRAALLLVPAAVAVGARAGTDVERQLDWQGRTRRFVIHIPREEPGRDDSGHRTGPLPVLLAYHGGGGDPRGFQRYAGLDAVADREGFAVVYPAGTGRFAPRLLTWNAGACCGYARDHGVDDVGFSLALLDALAREIDVDASRIYATGHSNGAMMAYRLAAEASGRLAAVVAVAGATPLEGFDPARPVAVLHVHSVDDPRALYSGGLGPPFPLTRIRSLHESVDAQIARWARRNGCAEQGHVVERRVAPEGRRDAGHTATKLSFAPCASGMDVELWRLTGAGHGWPGGRIQLPERLVGPETDVIDAAEEIWAFASRFVCPPSAEPAAGGGERGDSTAASELPIRAP